MARGVLRERLEQKASQRIQVSRDARAEVRVLPGAAPQEGRTRP
jgi:hypothetical protein